MENSENYGFSINRSKTPPEFCAETGGGAVLTSMALFGILVSTTHAISGAIVGVGATKISSAVRWGTGKLMIYAWIITIPASAAVAAISFVVIKAITNIGN